MNKNLIIKRNETKNKGFGVKYQPFEDRLKSIGRFYTKIKFEELTNRLIKKYPEMDKKELKDFVNQTINTITFLEYGIEGFRRVKEKIKRVENLIESTNSFKELKVKVNQELNNLQPA